MCFPFSIYDKDSFTFSKISRVLLGQFSVNFLNSKVFL